MTKHTVVLDFGGKGKKLVGWSSLARPNLAGVIAVAQKEFPGVELSKLYICDFFTIRHGRPRMPKKRTRRLSRKTNSNRARH